MPFHMKLKYTNYLTEIGADKKPFLNGFLLPHLHRIGEILSDWGCNDLIVSAGIFYPIYGTDTLDPLVDDTARAKIISLIGPAESLARTFGRVRRPEVWSGRAYDRKTNEPINIPPATLDGLRWIECAICTDIGIRPPPNLGQWFRSKPRKKIAPPPEMTSQGNKDLLDELNYRYEEALKRPIMIGDTPLNLLERATVTRILLFLMVDMQDIVIPVLQDGEIKQKAFSKEELKEAFTAEQNRVLSLETQFLTMKNAIRAGENVHIAFNG